MFNNEQELKQWIDAAEGEQNRVDDEWTKNREYYENVQAPTDLPKDMAYIVKNLCMPHVNLQVSKVVGGNMDKTLKGDAPLREQQALFLDDVLERNKFTELLLEKAENYRQVEGLGGWKMIFNPYRHGPYGLGYPELYALRPREILLDPNSADGWHDDDQARAHKKRMLVQEARAKWPGLMDKLNTDHEDEDGRTTKDHLYAYEVEFIRTFYVPSFYDPQQNTYFPVQKFVSPTDDDADGTDMSDSFVGGFVDDPQAMTRMFLINPRLSGRSREEIAESLVPIEQEVMFVTTIVNNEVIVEKPKRSGYSGYTIIPALHTVRHNDHKLPSSPLTYLRATQDRINGVSSLLYLEARKAIKQPTLWTGLSQQEQTMVKRKGGKVAENIFAKNTDARMHQARAQQLSPSLLQQHELDLQAFDLAGHTGEPDRGQPTNTSGRLYIAAQQRFDIPLYVPVVHLQNALVEVFRRILESFTMIQNPFSIVREIDGEERRVFFNTPTDVADLESDDEYNQVFNIDGIEVVNPTQMAQIPDIGVDIDTNTFAKESAEVQKAQVMFSVQQLHPIDYHRAMQPNKWKETYERALQFNQAMALAAQIGELSPQGQQMIGQEIEQVQNAEAATVIAQQRIDGVREKLKSQAQQLNNGRG